MSSSSSGESSVITSSFKLDALPVLEAYALFLCTCVDLDRQRQRAVEVYMPEAVQGEVGSALASSVASGLAVAGVSSRA